MRVSETLLRWLVTVLSSSPFLVATPLASRLSWSTTVGWSPRGTPPPPRWRRCPRAGRARPRRAPFCRRRTWAHSRGSWPRRPWWPPGGGGWQSRPGRRPCRRTSPGWGGRPASSRCRGWGRGPPWRSEAHLDGHVKEAVAEQVVSPGALASCAAAETVVGQGPFWVAFQLQNGGH